MFTPKKGMKLKNKDGRTAEIISVAHDNPQLFFMDHPGTNLTSFASISESETNGWSPVPEPWKPGKGESYWYIPAHFPDSAGYVDTTNCCIRTCAADRIRIATGNYFRTKEEAESVVEKIKKVLLDCHTV